jgi:23S rRNA (cytosine1962-C5)-methyltransferase
MPWIDPTLLTAFAAEGTTAHRLYSEPGAWIERLGDDALLSYQNPERLPALAAELEEWSKSHHLALRRIYSKFLPKQNAERIAPVLFRGEALLPAQSVVQENHLRFGLDFAASYSAGLFIDQRQNRVALTRLKPKRLLNLFAYTCAFSVAAARAGAETLSVDLSRKSLQRGEENFKLNQLETERHRFWAEDVLPTLPRLYRKKELFDVIILDPPTFSRGEKGRSFRAEKDLPALVQECFDLLTPTGHLLVSTNCTKLQSHDLEAMCREALRYTRRQADFKREPTPPDLPLAAMPTTLWLHLK